MSEQVTLSIDGQSIQVPKGTLLIEAARKAGIEIPHFCYHRKLKPVAACRMCLVEIEKVPKLQPACNTRVTQDTVVSTQSERVKTAQKSMLEFLLINHPLDCPVCDKGGECPLQDTTYRFGPDRTRFSEAKWLFEKPVSLGPHILLDRERCILCLRCVQFMREVAGHPQISVTQRGRASCIDTAHGRPLDSPFSGNVVELCPVGALTSKHYRFRARPWDFTRAPSLCPLCGCGCNTRVDVREGKIMRVLSRENPQVDDGWLCDRGRFSYETLNDPKRLRTPLIRRGMGFQEATWEEALEEITRELTGIRDNAGATALAAVASEQVPNEAAYLLQKLFRSAFGTPHVSTGFTGLDPALARLRTGLAEAGVRLADFPDVDQADAVAIIGADVSRELPILDLRLKKAADLGARLLVGTPEPVELDRYAAKTWRYEPGQAGTLLSGEELPSALESAERPLLLVGLGAAAAATDAVLALASRLKAREGFAVGLLVPGGNTWGSVEMGLTPSHLPGLRPADTDGQRREMEGLWHVDLPREAGRTGRELLEAAARKELQGLFILGADPAGEGLISPRLGSALRGLKFLVVQDTHLTATALMAHLVLPLASFAEQEGTLTNTTGRIQRLRRALAPPGQAKAAWETLSALARRMDMPFGYDTLGDLQAEIAEVVPHYGEAVGMRRLQEATR